MSERRSIIGTTIIILFLATPCFAQVEQPLGWLRDVTALESKASGSLEQRCADVAHIRKEVEEWISLHPGSGAEPPPAPEQPWNEEQLRSETGNLRQALESIIRNDPSHPFYLGATTVNVTTSISALSPVSDSLAQTEIQNRDALTVKDVIDYLPGVSVDHKAPRNQSGISIGGFDTRQVPLYQDSIPVYVPFDGYVDLTRYLTSDIAEVQVAKGYSSPLLGPNLLGGVINLVTREPRRKLEGDAFAGGGSGNLLNSGLHAGSRWRRFFFQGSADRLQSTYYPVSGSFRYNALQPDDHRANSYQRDERFRGRAAWTPTGRDSYVFSYSNQKGKAGDPPYAGNAPGCPQGNTAITAPCVTPKFWKWPYWNTDSYYFNSNSHLGTSSSVQLRAFYDHYPNLLDMFDDATYSTMNKSASSGILNYNDRSAGASGEVATRLLARNALSASFFLKEDTHHEETTTFSAKNLPSTTPEQTDQDLQSSFGFQDVITISSRIRGTAGFSADHLDGLQAQDLSSDKTHVIPFQVPGICGTAGSISFSSCTDHLWTYNPVGSVSYTIGESGTVFISFAGKSRFPTLRDRYSYKAGRAIPDPALLPERARTWSGGYSRAFARRTVAQVDFFRTDVRDEIENISFSSPLCSGGKGAGCQQPVNVGREVHEGFNLMVRSTPVPHLTLDANYSYLNRDISGTPGVFPTGTPRHKTVGTVTIRFPRNVTGTMSSRYESGIVAMSDNNLPLPAAKFATVDIGTMIPIRAGMVVQAGVKNLLDRNYYYWEGFPEQGRNLYLNVRYTF